MDSHNFRNKFSLIFRKSYLGDADDDGGGVSVQRRACTLKAQGEGDIFIEDKKANQTKHLEYVDPVEYDHDESGEVGE